MFTGIITQLGTIDKISMAEEGGKSLSITMESQTILPLGASIACNGICLTVTSSQRGEFTTDASPETLMKTTLGNWQEGERINLERPLRIGDEVGGHFVSGHVDGKAEITNIKEAGDCKEMSLKAPDPLKMMLAAKGSVTLDGISLTLNDVKDCDFTVMIIPHTWTQTILQNKAVGDEVNLEVDMLARYIERLVALRGNSDGCC